MSKRSTWECLFHISTHHSNVQKTRRTCLFSCPGTQSTKYCTPWDSWYFSRSSRKNLVEAKGPYFVRRSRCCMFLTSSIEMASRCTRSRESKLLSSPQRYRATSLLLLPASEPLRKRAIWRAVIRAIFERRSTASSISLAQPLWSQRRYVDAP